MKPLTPEIVAVIDSSHFYCGVVLCNDRVVRAADIVKYMQGWTRNQVRDHCRGKGWRIFIVSQNEK